MPPAVKNELLDLMNDVLERVCAPCAWRYASCVSIPKEGDLSNCHDRRGISLLDVVGKVVARILQERLQTLAEDELPESQSVFQAGIEKLHRHDLHCASTCGEVGSISPKPSSLSLTSRWPTTLFPAKQ